MTLTEFCGGEAFFDSQVSLNSTSPAFSNCFQQLVFDLVPCIFLWILAIPYYLVTRKSKLSYIPVSRLFKAKLVTTLLLWVFAWTNLIRSLWEWGRSAAAVPSVDLVVPLIVGVSMALAVLLLQFDRMKGIRSSGLLTCYWLLYLVSWLFIFISKVSLLASGTALSGGQILRCVTFFLSYVAVIVNFALCFIADNPPAFKVHDGGDLLLSNKEKPSVDKKHQTCPEENATFLSKITFWWFTRMVVLGYKRPLVDTDLWTLNKCDQAGNVAKHFLKNWNAELDKTRNARRLENVGKPNQNDETGKEGEVLIQQPSTGKKQKGSLLWAMCKTFGPYFLISSLLKIIQDSLSFLGPQILSGLITFTTSNDPAWKGYFFAIMLFVIAMTQSLILQQYFHVCFVVGMRLRSAIISAIYRKSLVLSNSARKESTVGEVVNLMSVDAQRFMDLMSYLNVVWSGPFQIVLALYFLWMELGPAVLAGLAVMILLIPVNAFIASKARALQVKQMGFKDERIKLMNEILNGIKVLKMYAWEMSFKDKITEIRSKELKQLRRAAYLNAASSFTFICAPFMVSLTTFAVYVMIDEHNVLDAQKAFVSLSLFNILRFPLAMLPMVVSSIVQASVSLQRLEKFLNNDELDESNVDRKPNSSLNMISIENGTFKWDNDQDNILEDISMSVPDGSLVAVVGQVGCGKSSLMSALLGDMNKTKGHVSVKGSVAYVPQQAWIQNLTVRDNITFGKKLDVCHYQDVVEACELKSDFDMLPAGDQTEIGERGINLSGGQKQRVAIARAVYQDAQVYLFDDPLSAVDSHVGKNIFDNVLGPGGMLRKKTRILVTHGLSFLPQVDKIFVMVDGRISEQGNYNELLEKDGAFGEFLRNYATTEDDEEFNEGDPTVMSIMSDIFSIHEEDDHVDCELEKNPCNDARRKFERQQSRTAITQSVVGPTCKYVPLKKKMEADRVCKLPSPKKVETENKLIADEKAETGSVKLSVFVTYMRSIGFFLSFLICLFYILQNSAQIYSSIWLSEWSMDPLNPDGTQNGTDVRLAVYGVLGLFQAILVMFSSFSMTYGSVAAAALMHFDMLSRIFRAPMAFFDTTPLGRVINRFSKDVYLVDEVIPRTLDSFLMTFFKTLGTFVVIIYSTPWFAAVIVPLLILYYFIQVTIRMKKYFQIMKTKDRIFVLIGALILNLSALGASKLLHGEMLVNLLRAPMMFFDQTPTGRIINRCSKDVDIMDNLLIRTITMFLSCLFRVIGTLFIISFATPFFLIPLCAILVLYSIVQRFYVRTSRQLKRLESISRSPIYSHFGETITGASTVRAYGLQKSFIKENESKVDNNQMSYYPNIVSNRWLALRLELVGNCIVLFAAIFAVTGRGSIDAGIVGLSISYAMQVTNTLNWMVRQSSELETNIVAVERVKEYSNVQQEAPLVVDGERPPDEWPASGGIDFDDYSTRYRPELDLVVKNITAHIKGGEKIGIVGRTGAGKSSLTLALFRIIESASGCIKIDGRNISKIGLQDLRSKLSVIPQDPVLFSGSLRMNLDPFDAYSDDELWEALEHSHLKTFVAALPSKLLHEVTEGGENLSVGQRQLVCLARALLRNSKILVLDEATAAVDLETDDLIQATIRVRFAECTTFTIAHRLNTIMDSTRVMVLDAGRVAEFDSPQNLLRDKRSIFYSMAKDAGLA